MRVSTTSEGADGDVEKPILSSPRERAKQILRPLLRPLVNCLVVCAYFAIGCAVYRNFEPEWTLLDCIYFQMVTVSTVGYGDFSPSDEGINPDFVRGFTVIWIYVGIVVVFTALAKAVTFFTDPLVYVVRRGFTCVCPQKGLDIDGNGRYDFYLPRHPLVHYPLELVPPFVIALAVQLGAAAVFTQVEGWTFGLALYHCMTTASTVGYGDITITTAEGRVVATIHILLSVAIITMLIAEVDAAAGRRAHAVKQLRLMRSRLDKELLVSLDTDGNGVTKLEFAIGMMSKLGLVQWSDVEPFLKQFDQLDVDGSGTLDKADLERGADREATRLGRDRASTLVAHFTSEGQDSGVSADLLDTVEGMIARAPSLLFGHRSHSESQNGSGGSLATSSADVEHGHVQMSSSAAGTASISKAGKSASKTADMKTVTLTHQMSNANI